MILIAPDKFKGTLTAGEACDIMADVFRQIIPDETIMQLPMADGGEGTADVLRHLLGLQPVSVAAETSTLRPIIATYYISADNQTAAIDAASVLSLTLLLADERNVMHTTSAPLGRLLRHIIAKHSPREIYLGIGGTSTSDGGAGMMQTLGAHLFDTNGAEITAPATPEILCRLARVDFSDLIPLPELHLLCDVDVPLLTPSDAPSAMTFAQQKGLSPASEPQLRAALQRWLDSGATSGGRFSGAGGGLISAFTERFTPTFGAEAIIRLAGISRLPLTAIVTGEGCVDSQTLMGKAAVTLARYRQARNIPVIAIGGTVRPCSALSDTFTRIFSTTDIPDADTSPARRLHATALIAARYLAESGVAKLQKKR